MIDPVTSQAQRPARLRRPMTASAAEDRAPAPPPVLRMALAVGLVAGLLETIAVLIRDRVDPRVTMEILRTNRHAAWMTLISDLVIFVACGVALSVAARIGPRRVGRLVAPILCGLAFLALLLTIRGLHIAACVVLACGLAARTAPWIEARARRASRWGLFGIGIVAAGLGAFDYRRVATAEARAMAALPPAGRKSPNVLLIVMDTVRAESLGLYGYGRDTTPNLARLVAERGGVRFDQARSPAPWTLPSHASMLTGRWPHELSCNVERAMDATHPTLGEFLARRGYATGGFVANTYYCNARYGLDRGFARYEDHYENSIVSPAETLRASTLGRRIVEGLESAGTYLATPSPRKTAGMINRDALAWIDRRGDRPFFAMLNYFDAHGPYIPPPGAERRFGVPESEATLKEYRKLKRREGSLGEADSRRLAELTLAASEVRRGAYDDCIASIDAEIGRLFTELDRRELLDNTLVIVTSDHGECFGEHALFGHGHSLYRPVVHVPLVIFPPGGNGGIVGDPVSLRDLPATVADLLGFGRESPFPGASLARAWGDGAKPAGPVLTEVEHQRKHPPSRHIPASLGPLWSLVTRENVYIRHNDGREELYDLVSDPTESRDLAREGSARPAVERHRAELGRLFGDGKGRTR